MPNHWASLAEIEDRVPPQLLSWLAEPGLLTSRVREHCGAAMRFRMLGPLREASLPEELQARLGVTDAACFLREIEFGRGAERIIFAQTVFPAATVAAFPWLRDLGTAPLGEALRDAGVPLTREPLEYSALDGQHPLAAAAAARQDGAGEPAGEGATVAGSWARRAVYRLAGHPLLVQEVFLPPLLGNEYAFEDQAMNVPAAPFAVAQPAVAIEGSAQRFPVHRIYCVGRNYAAHAREMGMDPAREPPCFFSKPADSVVANGVPVPYPPRTGNLHHEVELVVAIGKGGRDIPASVALEHVFGYAVGNDLTRRDLQAAAKAAGMPWDVSKGFDASAPLGAIRRASEMEHPTRGRIWLEVNGQVRQDANLDEMIWSVPEVIAELSTYFALVPGDLIFTGTPAGVGPLVSGDTVVAGIDGLETLRTTIT